MTSLKSGAPRGFACALIGLWLMGALAVRAAPVRAQPATAARDSFSFVVIGHLRGGEQGGYNYLVDELVRQVRELRPDLVFLTGDLIWGDFNIQNVRRDTIVADWERLDSALATIGAPIYRVPGNHDINDPITRDVYFQRYGRLPAVVNHRGVRFLLLNSSYVPAGDSLPPRRRPFIGGVPLDSAQVAFLRNTLADTAGYAHTFAFLHHVLWWEQQAPWWRTVHPILAGKVRAVFAGDYGPMKFSHVSRDGIDYIQSSIEDFPALLTLQRRIDSRLLYQQFDNFLQVTVDGPEVRIDVRTLGPISGRKFTPQRWHAIRNYSPPLAERMRGLVGTPKRLAAAILLIGATFLSGAAAALIWLRRRYGFSARPK